MQKGSIFAFINFQQAARFGHVGWGFEVDEKHCYFGSTDHLWKHDWWDLPAWLRYMSVPAEADIDWWANQGSKTEMLKMMKSGPHIRYHAYKELRLDSAKPQEAIRTAEALRLGGWDLARHNCVHQAFLVFSNYSSAHALPSPFQDPLNLIPKTWFARIKASEQQL
ncbi:MAG: hypothetical protein K2X27_14210 [Candidatus Obscuribacterales bacterium]|nr:hypothetical protein [Candidatus Obscuribacterales bacterium]